MTTNGKEAEPGQVGPPGMGPFFLAALVFADIALWFITLIKFGTIAPAVGAPVAAYSLLIVGLLGIYLATATLLNTVFKKMLYPPANLLLW